MLTVAAFPRKRQSTGAADPGSATCDQDHLSFQRPADGPPPLLAGALYLAPAIGRAAGLGAFIAYDWWWGWVWSLLRTLSRELGSGSGGCFRC
jgi:hypothetical protein